MNIRCQAEAELEVEAEMMPSLDSGAPLGEVILNFIQASIHQIYR